MSLGVFLDRDTVDCGDLDMTALLQSLPQWMMYPMTTREMLAARIESASTVVTNKTRLDAVALNAATQLRLICLTATGTNNIDLDAARDRGIAVCNVRGYATAAVVQHVFALILALTTRLTEYHQAVRCGHWRDSNKFCLLDYPIRELQGRALGIVGYGELGSAVGEVARAFGMRVLIAARPGKAAISGRTAFDEVLRRADVLSLHCPLTAETRGIIGARELSLMNPDALLINTARGGLVDEAALAQALRAGCLGGAGIDVLTDEPPVNGNPLLAEDIPNLIVTPHTAWASHEARQRVIDEVTANILAFHAGTPRNLV